MAALLVLGVADVAGSVMALTYGLYLCRTIGTGTIQDVVDPIKGVRRVIDPIRSALDRYVRQDGSGATYWDWLYESRALRLCLALCAPTVHTAIAADPDCTALSPQFATQADLDAWLDTAGIPPALTTTLEAAGFPMDWTAPDTTRRHVLRAVSQHHVILQQARRAKAVDVLAAGGLPLDTTISQLPLARRTALTTWVGQPIRDTDTLRSLWTTARATATPLHLGPITLS